MSRLSTATLGAYALCLWCCSVLPDEAPPDRAPEPTPAPALPEIQQICDGSDAARFVYAATLDYSDVFALFTAALGSQYLVVDGRCDYFLRDDDLAGLRKGHIPEEQASILATELQFGRYSSASRYLPVFCADAGQAVLQDDSDRLVGMGCERGVPPKVWSEAFAGIVRQFPSLKAAAQPAWGPTRLLAIRDSARNSGQVAAWTAALDLEERAIDGIGGTVDEEAGVLVQDEPTLAILSELRSGVDPAWPAHLLVEDSRGRRYLLLIRDEPPPAVAAAVHAALLGYE